jgi:hypothetical protein
MTLIAFLYGATTAGCTIAALFFQKFWRQSHDRLFLAFALAFWILAADYAVLGTVPFATEHRPWVFSARLLAFGLIAAGIVDKNRSGR